MNGKLYRLTPLTWTLVTHPSHMPYWNAPTSHGWHYYAAMLLRHGYAVMRRVKNGISNDELRFKTVEEAKEAAEKDYREFMTKGFEEVTS